MEKTNEATKRPWMVNQRDPSIIESAFHYIGECATLKKEVNEANAELIVKAVNAYDNLVEQLHYVRELLAIMHGDGGHHCEKVGTTQAIKDAIELLHKKWFTQDALYDINKLLAENQKLREAVGDMLTALNQSGHTIHWNTDSYIEAAYTKCRAAYTKAKNV